MRMVGRASRARRVMILLVPADAGISSPYPVEDPKRATRTRPVHMQAIPSH